MKKFLLTLSILLLSGAIGGCAGRGYSEGPYGGAYVGYHATAPAYGYPYSGYYAVAPPPTFHPPRIIVHPRPPLRPHRQMIIDRRHPERHFRYSHDRHIERRHDMHMHERSIHRGFWNERGRWAPEHGPLDRRLSRDRDILHEDRKFNRERPTRRGDFRRDDSRCIGARC
jgi:hypothetical protein